MSFSSHGSSVAAFSSSDCLRKIAGQGNIHQTHDEPKAGGEIFFIIFAFGKQSISLVTVLKKKKRKAGNASTKSYTLAGSLENTHHSGKVTNHFLFS